MPVRPFPVASWENEGLPSCPKGCLAMSSLPSHEGRRPSVSCHPCLCSCHLLDLLHPQRDSLPWPVLKAVGDAPKMLLCPLGAWPACPSGPRSPSLSRDSSTIS